MNLCKCGRQIRLVDDHCEEWPQCVKTPRSPTGRSVTQQFPAYQRINLGRVGIGQTAWVVYEPTEDEGSTPC